MDGFLFEIRLVAAKLLPDVDNHINVAATPIFRDREMFMVLLGKDNKYAPCEDLLLGFDY